MAILELLLGLSIAHASPPASPALVQLSFPDASGPAAETCDERLARAVSERTGAPPVVAVKEEPHPRVISDVPPEPDLSKMVRIDGASARLMDLPGSHPDALPLIPLEGSPEALASVGAVLQRAEKGERLRISVYGASHTSADWWTGELRRVLQVRYGDLGHGFIWPAALYKGYRGMDVNLCRTEEWRSDWVGRKDGRGDGLYGIGGASVSSNDPADFGWVETTRTNPQGRAVSRFEIFALAGPEGGALVVSVDEAAPQVVSTLAEAPGLLHISVRVPDGPHRLELRPKGDGEIRLFGVSAERDGPGAIVDAIGIRGKEARTWLSWDPTLQAEGLTALGPDLVVLAYGTNEANDPRYSMEKYREDLRAVLARLHEAAPTACLLVGPTDRGKKTGKDSYVIWDRTAPVVQVQREVAQEQGCAFWDWQQVMGGPGSMIAWALLKPSMGSSDLIHLSKAGYELSAHRLLAAMYQAAGISEPGRP